jgi:hypothetical protein
MVNLSVRKQNRLLLLANTLLAGLAFILLREPIAQDPAYHMFADQRSIWGIPNALNVLSNLPFIFAGLYGLLKGLKQVPSPRSSIYALLFIGIILTGLGSAYYHYAPSNETLVWDRIPMTIVFMSLLCAIIAERMSTRIALVLFPLLIITGISSVLYWHHTEALGRGDLRFYGIVQFYPMILIPLVLLIYRPTVADRSVRWLVWVITAYVIAKVCERFDTGIFNTMGAISGHSLKHLAAAASTFFIVKMTIQRYEPLQRV